MQPQRPDHPARRRIGIVTGVIAASLLGASAVAAQSPSPEAAGSTGTQPVPTMRAHQRPNVGGWGAGGGRGYGQQGDGRQGGRQGMGGPGTEKGFGRGRVPVEPGGRQLRRLARPAITVSAINAPVITLTTDDGWTRDIDTTDVAITRNGGTITLADIGVGDDIRLGQTRNDDGTWTVSRIDVQLAVVQGMVASVDTDSFTVTQADGTAITIRVSDTTRWVARRGNAAGLTSLTVGTGVVAKGVRAADGSIDAMAVGVGGTPPTTPTAPSASPSPGAAQG